MTDKPTVPDGGHLPSDPGPDAYPDPDKEYIGHIECEVCGHTIEYRFMGDEETTSTTCPSCDTYYPELITI